MAKILVGLVIFSISIASAKASSCPNNSSEHNHQVVFGDIAKFNWSIIAVLTPKENLESGLFQIPTDGSVNVDIEQTFLNTSGLIWQRLTFIFFCAENQSLRTFIEITKNYNMYGSFTRKTESFNRYCTDKDVPTWPNLFIHHNHKAETLMLYGCTEKKNFTIIMSSSSVLNKAVKVEMEVRQFWSTLNLNLTNEQDIKYVDFHNSSEGCGKFEHACLLKSLDEFIGQKKKVAFFSYLVMQILIGFLTIGFIAIIVFKLYEAFQANTVNDNVISIRLNVIST